MRAHITWALLLGLCWTARAHAWTDAKLTSVAAQLDVSRPEAARVELQLGLDVRPSWLSRLELTGLDPDFELLEASVSDAGAPEVEPGAPGQVWLRWQDRGSAPRRGPHSLRVVYQTRQLSAADGPRRQWALPRWPVSLSEVQVKVIGPSGLEALPPARANSGESVERAPHALTFTRAPLPRSEAYRVGFELPQPEAARPELLASLWSAWSPRSFAQQLAAELPQLMAAGAIGFLFACLVLLKRRMLREQAGALIPQLEAARHDALVFGLCLLSPLLLTRSPTLALCCALVAMASGLGRRAEPG
ncbi:MAG TPA: hypothetical protein VJV78_39725, partial [Polyangiales bacterium]|nr:hypothetical protein [Polyangiales bacterium]